MILLMYVEKSLYFFKSEWSMSTSEIVPSERVYFELEILGFNWFIITEAVLYAS